MAKKQDVSTLKFEVNPNYNRSFSEAFKKAKVKEIIEKRISVQQISELYEVSRSSVYRWIYKYSNSTPESKQVVQMESEALKTKRLLAQVAELERCIGQKQLAIDFLEATLSAASQEVGYDLKKKYAPKSLNNFEKVPTK